MPVTHHSRGIYRTQGQTQALKDAVLDAWAQGQDSHAIAEACGVHRDYVSSIVIRARRQGDARAVRRRAPNNYDGGLTQKEAVLAMHASGMTVPGIACIIGQQESRVRESLSRAGLR